MIVSRSRLGPRSSSPGSPRGEGEPIRDKVLQLIAVKYQVPVLGIRKVASGSNVIFELKADSDKILEPAATNDLKKLNMPLGYPQKSKHAVLSSVEK